MDLNRALLLLLYMAASEVQDIQTRPIDFVCDYQARRSMNKVEEIKSAMGECDGSDLLPSAIPLPCVGINMGAWRKKSLQQKRGQVLAALKVLTEGLKMVRAKTQNGCQSTLLERLEHSVTNYLHIVMNLDILQDKGEGQDFACQSRNTLNLDQVLMQYNKLLSGMLEMFMLELKDMCQGET
ncbi:thrombopoietin-like isoform X1 [Anguilla rostrata]|uniref:thrombopoietin-like isoform X1 n=1 Tax=Anguilla rostrata TaxID=7938 RepID=UPI0030D3250C